MHDLQILHHTLESNRVETKRQKFWGIKSYIWKICRGKFGRRAFLPPTPFLNRVKRNYFSKKNPLKEQFQLQNPYDDQLFFQTCFKIYRSAFSLLSNLTSISFFNLLFPVMLFPIFIFFLLSLFTSNCQFAGMGLIHLYENHLETYNAASSKSDTT